MNRQASDHRQAWQPRWQRWTLLFGITGATCVLAGYQLTRGSSQASERHPSLTPVRTYVVKSSAVSTVSRTFTGLITPAQASELAFKLTGRLETLAVDQGDVVQQGQLLAVLDTRSLRAERAMVEAELRAARAKLEELTAGPRKETIAAAQAKLKEFESRLQLWQITAERRQRLVQSNADSQQNLDDARLLKAAAQGQVDSQRQVLLELQAGTRTEQIQAQRAIVQQSESRLKSLEIQIEESHLDAPYDAVISRRAVDDGMVVEAGTVLYRIVSRDAPEAWIGLPIRFANGLRVGEEYRLDVGGQDVSATLKSRLPELSKTTRTQTVIFQLASSADVSFGQTVRFTRAQRREVTGFWLPRSALTHGVRGLWAVFVVTSDAETADAPNASSGERVERRDVEVLQIDSERVLVRGTLVEGEEIVASGVQKLVAGQRVRRVDFPAESR